MIKLKMLQKGLILVGVPLIVGISFCLILIGLFQQSEADLEREMRARTVVTKAAELSQLYYVNAMRLFVAAKTNDKLAMKKFDLVTGTADEDIRDLKKLVDPGSQQAAAVESIESASKDLRTIITNLSRPDAEESDSFTLERIQNISRLRNALSELATDLIELGHTAGITQRAAAQTLASRRRVTGFIALGIVIDVIVAAGLTVFFTKAISGRLDELCTDTRHLVREEPLGRVSDDGDEIGDLNRTLHQVARALAGAREKERALTNNAADVICSLNSDLEFVKVNPASLKCWDYSPEELIGKSLSDYVQDAGQLNLRQDGNDCVFETGFRHKSGQIVDMHWSSNWSAKDRLFFCVARDVSESKQAQRLRQQLIDMVSHDLRTPLTAINSLLTLLSMETFGPMGNTALRKITVARGESTRLIELVNNLLEVERIDSGRVTLRCQSVGVRELVDGAIDAIEEIAAPKSIKVIGGNVADVCVNLDRARITQVLINLISNSVKFSPDGEVVTVAAKIEAGSVTFSVADNGPGISLAAQQSLFNRFSQITQTTARHGAGLGLAICKHLIQLHGGEIGVVSPINDTRGSLFWFTIPLSAGGPAP